MHYPNWVLPATTALSVSSVMSIPIASDSLISIMPVITRPRIHGTSWTEAIITAGRSVRYHILPTSVG